MTFDEAMKLVRTRGAMVTRPDWPIMPAVTRSEGQLWYFKFDNTEGGRSGEGWPYKPSDEDRAAADWMLYQTPEENWVELYF